MAVVLYYVDKGHGGEEGPYRLEQLRELLEIGRVAPDDHVRCAGSRAMSLLVDVVPDAPHLYRRRESGRVRRSSDRLRAVGPAIPKPVAMPREIAEIEARFRAQAQAQAQAQAEAQLATAALPAPPPVTLPPSGAAGSRIWRSHLLVPVAIAMALFLVALGWQLWSNRPAALPRSAWFFDLNTLQLYPGRASAVPPVAAPSGTLRGQPAGTPAGVAAVVVREHASGQRRIAYLQTYTADIRSLLRLEKLAQGLSDAERRMVQAGTLVAHPPASPSEPVVWEQLHSQAGASIANRLEKERNGRSFSVDLP